MLDEVVLSDLMTRATRDVVAAPSAATDVLLAQRRTQRRRIMASAAATGVTAGAVAVVAVVGSAGSPTAPAPGATKLTAAQQTLMSLSTIAASGTPSEGRYAVMSERQDQALRTSVIDSLSGDVWTYQKGVGIPSELPVARHDSMTQAEYDAVPTGISALRAYLIAQYDQQQAAAQAAMQQQIDRSGKKSAIPAQPSLTADDKVFEQATDMLWSPLVGPSLRSALFAVLAATPDVVVQRDAVDGMGRPAIEISRHDAETSVTDATFEDPTTATVLETRFSYANGTRGSDLYLSTTRTDSLPGNPYVK